MKFKLLSACALFLLAVASASAQKPTTSGKCEKPTVQSIPAGDMDGHMYLVQTGKCTAKNEVHGAKATEGSFAENAEVTGSHIKAWGTFTETYDNGDKIFYSYTNTGMTGKDGKFTTGSNTYKIAGGTGHMKGLKGSGTCKLKGTDDGGLTFDCTGEYTSAMAKKAAPAATETK